MTVTEKCVSITTGTLGADKRVDYAFGMVLGLAEFQQEQQYFLQKDYLHERALHGYGTVYGLQVLTAPAADDPADYVVTVMPGMAIDQWGREVVVRSAQCARLGQWQAAMEQSDPGGTAQHTGISGELTVYVVVKYAQCEDDLVPLPGQPCSSSAATSVPSRIRDSWDIELQWTPPPMPAWDADRELARLLRAVQVVPGLDPALSSEEEITEAVLLLGDPVSGAGPPGPVTPLSPSDNPSGPAAWRLPAETAGEALDRIYTVWTTRVRPLLAPALTEPAEPPDPAILLAAIDFTLGPQSAAPSSHPVIASCAQPDDGGRPYVLHTRLMQELLLPGGGAVAPATAIELATLTSAVDDQGRLVLTAWFHLDEPVALTEPVQVRSRDGSFGSFMPSAEGDTSGVPPQFSDVWVLTQDGEFPLVDRDQVEVTFNADSTFVGDFATTLRTHRETQALDLLDTTPSGYVLAFGEVELPAAAGAPAAQLPMLEFVTLTPLQAAAEPQPQAQVQLWFHPQPAWPSPRVAVTELPSGLVQVFDELTQQRLPAVTQPVPVADNVWNIAVRVSQPGGLNLGSCLRFVFQITKIVVTVDGGERMTLPQWMAKAGISFVNGDAARRTITAYLQTRVVQKS